MLLALHTTNERSFEEKFAKFFVRMKGTTADSQTLREINSGDTKSAKSAVLSHIEAMNFDFMNFSTL